MYRIFQPKIVLKAYRIIFILICDVYIQCFLRSLFTQALLSLVVGEVLFFFVSCWWWIIFFCWLYCTVYCVCIQTELAVGICFPPWHMLYTVVHLFRAKQLLVILHFKSDVCSNTGSKNKKLKDKNLNIVFKDLETEHMTLL